MSYSYDAGWTLPPTSVIPETFAEINGKLDDPVEETRPTPELRVGLDVFYALPTGEYRSARVTRVVDSGKQLLDLTVFLAAVDPNPTMVGFLMRRDVPFSPVRKPGSWSWFPG